MNKTSRTLATALACGLSLPTYAAGVGNTAPRCPAKVLQSGGPLNLDTYKGKVVYLDFWASWCGPCAQSFPALNQLHRELKNQGFEVVAINLDDNPEEAADFLTKHPVDFTIASDPAGECPRVYGVQAMPSSYLIDHQGVIRHVHLGFHAGDETAIRHTVAALLAEQ